MSRWSQALNLIKPNIALWLLGTAFVALGAVLIVPALRMMQADAEWWSATTTTGRVIAVEWLPESKESRLRLSYGYTDEKGTIYHTTSFLARRRGKINLEPGAYVAVFYKPGDHSQSRLSFEVGAGEWMSLLGIGGLELLMGCFFLFVAARRLRASRRVEAGAKTDQSGP